MTWQPHAGVSIDRKATGLTLGSCVPREIGVHHEVNHITKLQLREKEEKRGRDAKMGAGVVRLEWQIGE